MKKVRKKNNPFKSWIPSQAEEDRLLNIKKSREISRDFNKFYFEDSN
jgi:hypothetical protein